MDELLEYITASQRSLCTVAVAPCQTMGGLEFRKFAPREKAQPPHNGRSMLWESLYSFIRDPVTNPPVLPQGLRAAPAVRAALQRRMIVCLQTIRPMSR